MATNNITIPKFNIETFDLDIQEKYFETEKQYIEDLERVLMSATLILDEGQSFEVLNSDRRPPQYLGLDAPYPNGMPIQEKIRSVLADIIAGNGFIYVFEGGVRGGKDIWGIYIWTQYLMICPETTHLVLGKSLEHAILTVLISNGFGLYYTIPNGIFERSSEYGAQRGVFKFIDAYGIEKKILFYGNDKERDHEKYQGFTIGSTYVNEGMAQHINGLDQAVNRMGSTHNHLMIITQNPKGDASDFYTKFEKPLLYTEEEIQLIEFIRDEYKQKFKEYEDYINQKRMKNAVVLRDKFFKSCGVPTGKAGKDFLTDGQKIELNRILIKNNVIYDKMLNSMLVKDFVNGFDPNHKFAELSMKKIVNYKRGEPNPNNIYNAINYTYVHFTCEDNLGMDETQKSEFKRTKGKPGTATYDRDVLGIRRSTEGAIYPMFSKDNIIGDTNLTDEEFYEKFEKEHPNTFRVIAIDSGFNHSAGLIDGEVDFKTGIFYQLNEMKLDLKGQEDKGEDYIYQKYLELVRKRKGRKLPDYTLIDPSAESLRRYFISKNINIRKANNSVFKAHGKDKTDAIKTENKDVIGIPLVQTAMSLLKYFVYYKCRHTISQIGSYETKWNETKGEEEVVKINDDLVDPVRYVYNTLIRPSMWGVNKLEGDEKINDEQQTVDKQLTKWEYHQQTQELFNDEEDGIDYDPFDRSSWFGGNFFS